MIAKTDNNQRERPTHLPAEQAPLRSSTRSLILAGTLAVASLVGLTVVWGSVANIAGAVIAPARTIVDTNPKQVQHQGGGIVKKIRIRNGDRVEAGDLLVQLDDTVPRANLGIINQQLVEYEARAARLSSELRGAQSILIPKSLKALQDRLDTIEVLDRETKMFEVRKMAHDGEREQLRHRRVQLDLLIEGKRGERDALKRELELVEDELIGLHTLKRKDLIRNSRLTTAKRSVAQLQGRIAATTAEIAKAGERIGETALAILQLERESRSKILGELQDAKAKIAELQERRITAADALRRIDIRAPRSGHVHDLAVHTVGGVVNSGETILTIVPVEDDLVLEARIAPTDIDQVIVGQKARVRFSGLSQRTTPEYLGEIVQIGADVTEQRDGLTYYVARISLSDALQADAGALKLMPGMPAEVFVATTSRSAISYFLKPLLDQFARAFRED